MMEKLTIEEIKKFKGARKITMLTAYDFVMAQALEEAQIDLILVGDSLANVVLGLDSTKSVGINEMVYHSKAVRRASQSAFIIGDMPFDAYQKSGSDALGNARRFVEEGGCSAVKLEWFDGLLPVLKSIVAANIPVMGHIGLTPQTAVELGGFKVQGKTRDSARTLLRQAKLLEAEGCFSLVLECIPDLVAQLITEAVGIPTIGIGAGPYCDGQVLVSHDMLGLFDRYSPKFVKKFCSLKSEMIKAFRSYKDQVTRGEFPGREHSYPIDPEQIKDLTSCE